ncbi:MAG: DUF494 family protein [Chloroflexota bacterium]
MSARVVEIIELVLGELKGEKRLADIDVTKLHSEGYSPKEISAAISWVADKLDENGFNNRLASKSFRTLHPAELELFTPEAAGEVVRLSLLGLLKPEQVDYLIERAVMGQSLPVSADNVKSFTSHALFGFSRKAAREGSRFYIDESDSIN